MTTSVITRKCSSVDQFCADHAISRAMFYKLLKEGRGPRLMKVGTRTLVSDDAAAAWRRMMEVAGAAGGDRPAA